MNMSKGAAIFGWARLLAPIILGNIKQTKAIAPKVGGWMDEAEALKDSKTGQERLGHVVNLGLAAGDGINAEKPGTVDMAVLQGAMAGAINTAFQIAALAHQEHGDPVADPTVIPAAPAVPISADPVAVQTPDGSGSGSPISSDGGDPALDLSAEIDATQEQPGSSTAEPDLTKAGFSGGGKPGA